jgi:hypothetical protein
MEGEWCVYSEIYDAAFGYVAIYRVCKSRFSVKLRHFVY